MFVSFKIIKFQFKIKIFYTTEMETYFILISK